MKDDTVKITGEAVETGVKPVGTARKKTRKTKHEEAMDYVDQVFGTSRVPSASETVLKAGDTPSDRALVKVQAHVESFRAAIETARNGAASRAGEFLSAIAGVPAEKAASLIAEIESLVTAINRTAWSETQMLRSAARILKRKSSRAGKEAR